MSPSLFNDYIADMPSPTPPVKRICYADDITVWDSGPNIPQLETMINSYLRDVSIYMKENSLLISAPKSTVTLFTPDKHQFQTHPDITLEDTQLPLERSAKILGVIMDPSLSFHKHCNYVSDRIDERNNMLKGRFDYAAPRKQQSTEGASTPNIGQGAETEPKTTMHSLLLLYSVFNHPRLLIQVARVQKAQFSYRLDGLVP